MMAYLPSPPVASISASAFASALVWALKASVSYRQFFRLEASWPMTTMPFSMASAKVFSSAAESFGTTMMAS